MTQIIQNALERPKGAFVINKITRRFSGKSLRFYLMFFCVYIPTALLFVYLTVLHTPMYISESFFALRSSDGNELPSIAGIFSQGATNTIMDAHIVQNHISSMDMMDKVDAVVDLKAHYGDRSRDIYSRLKANPTKEEMLEYWQWIVSATFSLDKGIISVTVKAYTSEMSKRINDTVLQFSEELVNQMNSRAHQDALRLTSAEVAAAEKRVLQAQKELRQFRDDKSILDPEATAKGLEGVIAQLEAEAASTQAELTAALQVMQPGSPRVQTLETRLRALQEQLVREKTKLAGMATDSTTLSSLVGDYAQLATEEQFAQKQLVHSMSAFEAARLKAISQSRYIVPFQPPTLPQESLYPRPFLFTALGFLTLLIVVGLCSLIIAAIKDHMGV